MYLDPSSVFVPGENAMYVVTSGGIVRVQGNDLHRLHGRLQRSLERARSVDELVAAVPAAHAAVVGSYLRALRDARVLLDAPRVEGPALVTVTTENAVRVASIEVAGVLRYPRYAFQDGAFRGNYGGRPCVPGHRERRGDAPVSACLRASA